MALPETSAGEPEDGNHQMICDAVRPSRHLHAASSNSAPRRSHRIHTSQPRKRHCATDPPQDQYSTEMVEVDPCTLAMVEQYMQQAAFAVQVSAGEAQTVQLKLAESHAEVTALLATTQASVCREQEQVAVSSQLRSQLEMQWTELNATAVAATESARNEATEKCQVIAGQCQQMMQQIALEADALVLEANRRTKEQVDGYSKIEEAYKALLPEIQMRDNNIEQLVRAIVARESTCNKELLRSRHEMSLVAAHAATKTPSCCARRRKT